MARSQPYRRPRRFKTLRIAALVAVMIGVAVLYRQAGSWIEALNRAMPVRQVRIEGEIAGVNPDELQAALLPLLQGSFLMLDVKALEKTASEVPWVGDVKVTRIWPDTLELELREQIPVARWGNDQLIAEAGEIFSVPSQEADFSHLVKLHGPRGREREVLGMCDRLGVQFEANGQKLVALELSDRLAWTAELADGLRIVYGNQDPTQVTDRLQALLPNLQRMRAAEVRSVDLRYPRGFAVSWKHVGEPG